MGVGGWPRRLAAAAAAEEEEVSSLPHAYCWLGGEYGASTNVLTPREKGKVGEEGDGGANIYRWRLVASDLLYGTRRDSGQVTIGDLTDRGKGSFSRPGGT